MVDTPPPPSGGIGLQKRIGPLPAWGWIAIAAAAGIVGVVYLQYRRKASSASTSDTSGSTTDSSSSSDDLGNDEAILSQIRDLQGSVSQVAANTTPSGPVISAISLGSATKNSLTATWSYSGSTSVRNQIIFLNNIPHDNLKPDVRSYKFNGLRANTSYSVTLMGIGTNGQVSAAKSASGKTSAK